MAVGEAFIYGLFDAHGWALSVAWGGLLAHGKIGCVSAKAGLLF